MPFFFPGCDKDNDEELKEQEMRLLEQYLVDNDLDTLQPTASGFYYIELTEGTGTVAGQNYWVDFDYIAELVDGTVIGTSYQEVAEENGIYNSNYIYGPLRLKVGYTGVPGLDEGFPYMREGGKAKMILPSNINGFGKMSTDLSPAYSTHIYTIDLIHAFNDPETFQTNQIILYMQEKGIEKPLVTESGLYYIEIAAGEGEYIQNGDVVEVWYTGSFLDGRVFDTNIGGNVLTVDMPATNYIPAWDEALKLMQNGTRAKIIVPYQLGYQDVATGPIPPYSTLVFDVEIESVVPVK